MIFRSRRALALALAPSVFAIGCGVAAPARAQVYLDGTAYADDDERAPCVVQSVIYVIDSHTYGTGLSGHDVQSVKGIGFGNTGGYYDIYFDAYDGSAYFSKDLDLRGSTLVTGTTQFDGAVTLNSGVIFNGGLNSHGITNNSNGIINYGGFTSTGKFTNNGSFTNNGDLIVRDDLSTDTLSANYVNINNSASISGVLHAYDDVFLDGQTSAGQMVVNGSLRLGTGATTDLGGVRLQNVGAPVDDGDAATKAYVDSASFDASAKADHAQATANHAQASADQAQASADQAQATADTAIAHEDTLGQDSAAAFGGGAAYDPATGHLSAPSYTVGTASYGSVGAALQAANTTGLAYFHANSTRPDGAATGTDSVAIGPASKASASGAFAAGNGATASAAGAVAIGQGAQATGVNAIAIGAGAKATGSVAVGVGASAANGGAAYGDRSTATGANSVALGSDASAIADNAVAIGSGSVATAVDTVSVGTAASQRRVVNVAAGVASSDAVTVGQLATGGASVAAAFGAGSVVGADGTISAPSYALAGATYHDVGSALLGLSDRIDGVVGLAYDIRKEERRGIAAATALATAPMPSAPGRTSWVANTAVFHGEVGFGGSLAHRFDTHDPLALTAGVAYAPGGNTVAKVGMAGEF